MQCYQSLCLSTNPWTTLWTRSTWGEGFFYAQTRLAPLSFLARNWSKDVFYAVLRFHREFHASCIQPCINITIISSSPNGMGHTLTCGIGAATSVKGNDASHIPHYSEKSNEKKPVRKNKKEKKLYEWLIGFPLLGNMRTAHFVLLHAVRFSRLWILRVEKVRGCRGVIFFYLKYPNLYLRARKRKDHYAGRRKRYTKRKRKKKAWNLTAGRFQVA